MKMQRVTLSLVATVFGAGLSLPAMASTPGLAAPDKETAEQVHSNKPIYSPYAGRNFPTLISFGNAHLHITYSMDVGAFDAQLRPDDAYRFDRVIGKPGFRFAGTRLYIAYLVHT